MLSPRRALWIMLATTPLVATASLAGAPSNDQSNDQLANDAGIEIRSAEGFTRDRNSESPRDPASLLNPTEPLQRVPRQKSNSGPQALSAYASDAWIYDANVTLFHDFDQDGYYHYLRVRFDADSYHADHWVYARLYLSADGQYWDEYHVTDDFLINGTSPYDDYEVETELTIGFPPGLYDVLIELYDADYGDFLGDFGPADSSALSLLPLEDLDYDGSTPVVTVSHEHGGGATDVWLLAAFLLVLLARRYQARSGSSTTGS